MTKSEIIKHLIRNLNERKCNAARDNTNLNVKTSVNAIFDKMVSALFKGKRIEIRSFCSFSIRTRPPGKVRNPWLGVYVDREERRIVYFRPCSILVKKIQKLS